MSFPQEGQSQGNQVLPEPITICMVGLAVDGGAQVRWTLTVLTLFVNIWEQLFFLFKVLLVYSLFQD